MLRRIGAAAASLALFWAAGAGAAPAKLVAETTGFVIEGEILDFDGESYLIDGPIGRLRVPAAGVRCEGEGCPAAADPNAPLRIVAGSAADFALAARLIEGAAFAEGGAAERELGAPGAARFRLLGPDDAATAAFLVETMDAAAAYAALAEGSAELGFVGRGPNEAEVAAFGLGAARVEIAAAAIDGLAFIVAPGNPLGALTPDEAARIFSGAARDWAEFGGPAGPIRAIAPEGGEEAAALAAVTGAAPSEALERISDPRALAEAVAADPAAIGFAGIGAAGAAKPLALDSGCGLLRDPSRFSVKAGDWPLTLARRVVTGARRPAPAAAKLFEFARSQAAQPDIADLGLADRRLETLPVAAQGRRLADAMLAAKGADGVATAAAFVRAVGAAERLSATVRYASGAAETDPQMAAALDELSRRIEAAAPGRPLLLAGFASPEEGPKPAALAAARAKGLAAALAAAYARSGAAAPEISAEGFADAAPLGCPGEATNRRVEIWLR